MLLIPGLLHNHFLPPLLGDDLHLPLPPPFGVILGLYWGHIGIMENKMETTMMGYIGGMYGLYPHVDGFLCQGPFSLLRGPKVEKSLQSN